MSFFLLSRRCRRPSLPSSSSSMGQPRVVCVTVITERKVFHAQDRLTVWQNTSAGLSPPLRPSPRRQAHTLLPPDLTAQTYRRNNDGFSTRIRVILTKPFRIFFPFTFRFSSLAGTAPLPAARHGEADELARRPAFSAGRDISLSYRGLFLMAAAPDVPFFVVVPMHHHVDGIAGMQHLVADVGRAEM